MASAYLEDRGVLEVRGAEARDFLQGLVTCDLKRVAPGAPRFGALLTPQGKIIIDFIVSETADRGGFRLDAPRALLPDLLKRLRLYRLRARIELVDVSDAWGVAAFWDGEKAPAGAEPDPRHPELGLRLIAPRADLATIPGDPAAYEARRIACGVPRGGVDFAYGEAFPHEVNMDLLAGVDFDKGCYVGQEVVSRVQHRGTARRRIMQVSVAGEAQAGALVHAGEIEVGTLGSRSGALALASLRLDKVEDARARGLALRAGDAVVTRR